MSSFVGDAFVDRDDEYGEAEAGDEKDSNLIVEEDDVDAELEGKAPGSVETGAEIKYPAKTSNKKSENSPLIYRPVCVSGHEVNNLYTPVVIVARIFSPSSFMKR